MALITHTLSYIYSSEARLCVTTMKARRISFNGMPNISQTRNSQRWLIKKLNPRFSSAGALNGSKLRLLVSAITTASSIRLANLPVSRMFTLSLSMSTPASSSSFESGITSTYVAVPLFLLSPVLCSFSCS